MPQELDLCPLPPGCILVTLDVSSLYTNIPHAEGIEACRKALETRGPEATPPTPYFTRLMEQILTFNNFSFNGEHYLQVQGTAMGTRMAPSYTNLFMANLEQRLLTWTTRRPHVWWRFIDDIFAIWQHGQESLQNFLQQINSFHPTIRFTSENTYHFWIPQLSWMEGLSIQIYIQSQPTPTNISHRRVAIPNTAPPQSHTVRASGSDESAPERRTFGEEQQT